MNRKGITLVELVIYIALLAVVALLIGKQFSGMIKNYGATKRISRQQSDSRDACAIMARDIRNTGFKAYLADNTGTLTKKIVPGTYVSAANDMSSFVYQNGNPGDVLTFYKARLDHEGKLENGIDTISYYLDGTDLVRKAGSAAGLVVAENIYALQFQYGVSAKNDTLVNLSSKLIKNWVVLNSYGSTPGLSTADSVMLLTFQSASIGQLKYTVPFALTVKQKLSVTVRIIPQLGFPANLDSLRMSVKTVGGTLLGSERFIPYDADILLTIPVQPALAAMVVLDYAAKGSGTLQIGRIDVVQTDRGSYVWTDTPDITQKRYVRAIKFHVLSRSKEKTAGSAVSKVQIADATIDQPAHYTWRVFTETVETPNNGVF